MSEVLVSRLLKRLDELDALAVAAGSGTWQVEHSGQVNDDGEIVACDPGCDCCVVDGADIRIYDEGGHDGRQATHIAVNDPDSVLRLCRAHRDLIAEWRKRQQMADLLGSDEDSKDSDAHIMQVGIAAGLQAAVVLVARGLGVEETD